MTDEYGKIHTDGSRSGGQPLDDSVNAKALALLNEVLSERVHWQMTGSRADNASIEALCRAIEQHEAFKQKVSDVVEKLLMDYSRSFLRERLGHFIIAKPKPDPLADVLEATFAATGIGSANMPKSYPDILRATLEALGFEIREKGI